MKQSLLIILMGSFFLFPSLLFSEGEKGMPSMHEEIDYSEEDLYPYDEIDEEDREEMDVLPDISGETQKRPFEGVSPAKGTNIEFKK